MGRQWPIPRNGTSWIISIVHPPLPMPPMGTQPLCPEGAWNPATIPEKSSTSTQIKAVTAGCYVFVQIRTKTGGEPDPRLIRRLAKQTRTKIVLQQFNPAKLSDIAVKDVVCMHRIVGSGE